MHIPNNWKKLRPHRKQAFLYHSSARFLVVRAGRRAGKTEIARRKIVNSLAIRKPWSDPNYIYGMPTYKQAKRVAWKPLKKQVPQQWIAPNGISESDMSITTIFGSTLYVVGMDQPQRVEGLGVDGVVLDERADMKPGIWSRTILPMLTDRNGWLMQIGVAKRFGIGSAEFNDLFNRGLENRGHDIKKFISLTWPSRDILDDSQLEFAREELDDLDYAEQFEADEIDIGGDVYHQFSQLGNVRDDIVYNPNLPILVGSDFNVDPMGWVLGQEYVCGENGTTSKELHIFDELFLRNTNTQSALDELSSRFKHHTSGWYFYGDATSRARKTSSGRTVAGTAITDYYLIASHTHFSKLGARIDYPKSNPAIADRQGAVNSMLCNAKKQRRLLVSPKCTHLINDLKNENRESNPPDIGHIADGLGYLVWRRYPLRIGTGDNAKQIGIYSYS